MATAGRISGTVIQALRRLGEGQVDDRIVSILREKLTADEKDQLLKDIRYAPIWIARIFREVAGERRD